MTTKTFRPLFAAAVCAVAVVLASLGGAIAPPGAWYAGLTQPVGTPPDLAFPIAWSTLYVFMAIAAWRVWRARGIGHELGLFGLQLVINACWMPVAFGLQWLGGALVVIAALWLAVAATMMAFWRADRLAGWLLVPYLAWVSYATYLNVALVWLN